MLSEIILYCVRCSL